VDRQVGEHELGQPDRVEPLLELFPLSPVHLLLQPRQLLCMDSGLTRSLSLSLSLSLCVCVCVCNSSG